VSGKIRVVLDTNVLVSGFGYPASVPAKVLALALDRVVDLVLSQAILAELIRTIPRIKHLDSTAESLRVISERLVSISRMVEPVTVDDPDLQDVADRPVLGTLLASGADFLVTGDKDLLVLAGRYPIVTPAEFWARHG
jgi:putative PIN family toxin of toxin-antitoxin system